MSTELHRALAELTDVPPPDDLAAKAIRLAERRRRNRVVAGATAVVLAVAVVVPLMVRPEREPRPVPIAPTPTPTATAPALPATPQVAAFAYTDLPEGSYILDRTSGQYRLVPYRKAVPSPDGRRFFVGDEGRGGILDGAGGTVRWIDGYDGRTRAVEWSPDGRWLLFTRPDKDGPNGFSIVDAATGQASGGVVSLTDIRGPDLYGQDLFWSRDGQSIGRTVTVYAEANPEKVIGIRFYSRQGVVQRTVDLDGVTVVRDGQDISPDGKRAAAVLSWGGEQLVEIIDLETGSVTHRFAAGDVVGWYGLGHLVVRGDKALDVVDLTGRVVRSLPGSWDLLRCDRVHLVAATGLPAASARYAF